MAGERSGEPLVVGEAFPLSAFAPLAATFRLIERDLRGIMLPLFAAGFVASLDLLLLAFAGSGYPLLILGVLWWPISSYCNAGMLSFALRVLRNRPYRFRDVWIFEGSTALTVGIAWLKLIGYGGLALVAFGVTALLELVGTRNILVHMVLTAAFMLLVIVVASRISVAPAVLVDRRANPLRALYDSVRLTQGHGVAIAIYFLVLSMIAGLTQAFAGLAVLSALATPGIVYLYLALRGELVG